MEKASYMVLWPNVVVLQNPGGVEVVHEVGVGIGLVVRNHILDLGNVCTSLFPGVACNSKSGL